MKKKYAWIDRNKKEKKQKNFLCLLGYKKREQK